MWRKCFIAIVVSFLACDVAAQSSEELDAVMLLMGCRQAEDLDEYELERLCHFIEHPVRINSVSVAFLRSCGLFTPYQAASLIDYRLRHGDVMSLNELSSVDGFSRDVVKVLSPFISIAGGKVSESASNVSSDLAVKGGISISDVALAGGYGMKYRCEASGIGTASLSLSRASDGSWGVPDACTGHLAWNMKKVPVRILAGDYNARFGQGLALWNGFSMSGTGKSSSFLKSSSGLSSSWSFTGSNALTGVASEISVAKIRISALLALPGIKSKGSGGAGLLPALNLGWFGRNMTASFTHYAEFQRSSSGVYIPDMKTAADVAICMDGVDVFGEIAYDWANRTGAVLSGMVVPCGEEVRTGLHLRCYPPGFNPSYSAAVRSGSKCSNEYAVSLSSEYLQKSGFLSVGLSLDASYRPVPQSGTENNLQLKILNDFTIVFSDSFRMKFRLSERLRTWGQKSRTDVRTDLQLNWSRFVLCTRINLLRCKETGLLGYVEGGYKTETLSAYLRAGIYRIDNWDDRIYVYERDAPGNFTVPAMYGRGTWLSFSAAWKYARWGRLYLRATKKPGKAELKLQSVFSF